MPCHPWAIIKRPLPSALALFAEGRSQGEAHQEMPTTGPSRPPSPRAFFSGSLAWSIASGPAPQQIQDSVPRPTAVAQHRGFLTFVPRYWSLYTLLASKSRPCTSPRASYPPPTCSSNFNIIVRQRTPWHFKRLLVLALHAVSFDSLALFIRRYNFGRIIQPLISYT